MNEEFATIYQHKKNWKIFVVGTKQIKKLFFFKGNGPGLKFRQKIYSWKQINDYDKSQAHFLVLGLQA